jgi:hypothetical protein
MASGVLLPFLSRKLSALAPHAGSTGLSCMSPRDVSDGRHYYG